MKLAGGVPNPAGGGTPAPAPVYRPVAREEVAAAAGGGLGAPPHPADDAAVADFLRFAQRRGINASAAWLADAAGTLAWAVLPIVSPGRTMLLLGPAAGPTQPAAVRL